MEGTKALPPRSRRRGPSFTPSLPPVLLIPRPESVKPPVVQNLSTFDDGGEGVEDERGLKLEQTLALLLMNLLWGLCVFRVISYTVKPGSHSTDFHLFLVLPRGNLLCFLLLLAFFS